jgi:hypothetical protein
MRTRSITKKRHEIIKDVFIIENQIKLDDDIESKIITLMTQCYNDMEDNEYIKLVFQIIIYNKIYIRYGYIKQLHLITALYFKCNYFIKYLQNYLQKYTDNKKILLEKEYILYAMEYTCEFKNNLYEISNKFLTSFIENYEINEIYSFYLFEKNKLIFLIMKENKKEINEEIIKYFHHPKRMQKWIESGETMEEFLQIYG